MAFATGLTLYTFAAVTFIREAGGDEVVPWMYPELNYTLDPVLGGTVTYLDIGATVAPPMTFRASFLSAANRFTFISALGTTGTLTSTTGPFTASVTLTKAIPVNQGAYKQYLCDVTFEKRP